MKKYSLFTFIGFYSFAGLNHFIVPDFYLPLIPDYFPFPTLLNYLSGALEIILGILLIFPIYRKQAVYGIVLLLVIFIPSHLYFIEMGNCFEGYLCIPAFASWFRLLIVHPFLILWAWSHRKNSYSILNQ